MSGSDSRGADDSRVLDEFLNQQPDLDVVEAILPDLNGRLRGKWLARSSAAKALSGGLKLPLSALAFDVWGRDPEAWVFDSGDVDGICVPDLRTLKTVPWLERPTGQLLVSLREASGRPCAYDPRTVLQNAAERLQGQGLTPVLASEMEFYLFQAGSDSDGCPMHTQTGPGDAPAIGGDTYGIDAMQSVAGFMHAVRDACAVQGLPVDTLIAEAAPSQYEINLFHEADALQAADHGLLLQRAIKGVAQSLGLRASFMAKPFADLAGNGMHVHCSLVDDNGANVFNDGTDEGAELLRQAIAGCLTSLPDCMLLFAPHLNSYRRFRRASHAPLSPSWGYDNRTVALRVPAGPPQAMRIEHRVAGADANPYLVVAAILAGISSGIERGMQAPAATVGNAGAELSGSLPMSWEAALAAFTGSEFVREYFGEEFQRVYAGIKQQEMDEFARSISTLEYHTYL
jgi:glutamine synthetase